MELKYCITCEKMDEVEKHRWHNLYHMVTVMPHSIAYLDVCFGPFTNSPPPPLLSDEQWEVVFKAQPSDEELRRMNQEAETLIGN